MTHTLVAVHVHHTSQAYTLLLLGHRTVALAAASWQAPALRSSLHRPPCAPRHSARMRPPALVQTRSPPVRRRDRTRCLRCSAQYERLTRPGPVVRPWVLAAVGPRAVGPQSAQWPSRLRAAVVFGCRRRVQLDGCMPGPARTSEQAVRRRVCLGCVVNAAPAHRLLARSRQAQPPR